MEAVAGTEAAKKELAELMAKAAEEAKKEEERKKVRGHSFACKALYTHRLTD